MCTTYVNELIFLILFYIAQKCGGSNINGCNSTPGREGARCDILAASPLIMIGWFERLVTGGLFGFSGHRF